MFNTKVYLTFLFASLAISIGLQMILPWPFGLIAALAIFIALPLYLRKRYVGKMGGYDRAGMGGGLFGLGQRQGGVKYVCLVCNNSYKGGACPRCGSKIKRADF